MSWNMMGFVRERPQEAQGFSSDSRGARQPGQKYRPEGVVVVTARADAPVSYCSRSNSLNRVEKSNPRGQEKLPRSPTVSSAPHFGQNMLNLRRRGQS
jgi:hypothetical protein